MSDLSSIIPGVPGVIRDDVGPQANKPLSSAVWLSATPEMVDGVKEELDRLEENPGTYNLLLNNCTTVPRDILGRQNFNIPSFTTIRPEIFIKELGKWR